MIWEIVLLLLWFIFTYLALEATERGLNLGLTEGGIAVKGILKLLKLRVNMRSITVVKFSLVLILCFPILIESLRIYLLVGYVIGTIIDYLNNLYKVKMHENRG